MPPTSAGKSSLSSPQSSTGTQEPMQERKDTLTKILARLRSTRDARSPVDETLFDAIQDAGVPLADATTRDPKVLINDVNRLIDKLGEQPAPQTDLIVHTRTWKQFPNGVGIVVGTALPQVALCTFIRALPPDLYWLEGAVSAGKTSLSYLLSCPTDSGETHTLFQRFSIVQESAFGYSGGIVAQDLSPAEPRKLRIVIDEAQLLSVSGVRVLREWVSKGRTVLCVGASATDFCSCARHLNSRNNTCVCVHCTEYQCCIARMRNSRCSGGVHSFVQTSSAAFDAHGSKRLPVDLLRVDKDELLHLFALANQQQPMTDVKRVAFVKNAAEAAIEQTGGFLGWCMLLLKKAYEYARTCDDKTLSRDTVCATVQNTDFFTTLGGQRLVRTTTLDNETVALAARYVHGEDVEVTGDNAAQHEILRKLSFLLPCFEGKSAHAMSIEERMNVSNQAPSKYVICSPMHRSILSRWCIQGAGSNFTTPLQLVRGIFTKQAFVHVFPHGREDRARLPFEAVFNSVVAHVLPTLMSTEYTYSQEVPLKPTGNTKAVGVVDHIIENHCHLGKVGLELVKRGNAVQEHVDRFDTDGKYTRGMFETAIVVVLGTGTRLPTVRIPDGICVCYVQVGTQTFTVHDVPANTEKPTKQARTE